MFQIFVAMEHNYKHALEWLWETGELDCKFSEPLQWNLKTFSFALHRHVRSWEFHYWSDIYASALVSIYWGSEVFVGGSSSVVSRSWSLNLLLIEVWGAYQMQCTYQWTTKEQGNVTNSSLSHDTGCSPRDKECEDQSVHPCRCWNCVAAL